MTASFTSKFLTAALGLSLLAGGSGVMAQTNTLKFSTGITATKPIEMQAGSHLRTNGLVSRPGNSQDFVATGGGNWQHQTNSAYTYDSQGRLRQRFYTDPVTNQNLGREKTTYDANDNEIEYLVEAYNGTAWEIIDGSRNVITYNAKGNKTELIYEYWDTGNNTWQQMGREQTDYDANDRVTSLTSSSWNGIAWDLEERMVLTHVGGTATSALMQEYNNGVWEDAYRATNLTWHVLYEMPSAYVLEVYDRNAWVKEQKYAAVYDANGGHVGIYEDWNGTTWVNASRETETYDNNKNFTGWLDENWSLSTNSWTNSSEERQVLTYSGMDITQRIFQDSWSSATGTLTDRVKEVYSNFQTFNIAGVKDLLPETAVNVYPNPAIDQIQIQLTENKGAFTATVADATGKTWLTRTFQAGQENAVNIEALPKGVYLLQLQTENGRVVKRIVKQ